MSDRHDLTASFAHAAAPAVMVDFDGTISNIVATPDAARPVAGAVDVLSRLADDGVAVTVLSSRPVDFLLGVLVGIDPSVRMVGHSGFEVLVDGRVEVDHHVAEWAPVVRQAYEDLDPALPDGIRMEDKGLSFALHYRERPEAGPAAQEAAAKVAAATGLSLKPGRMNIELRPPVAVDKGTAVRSRLTTELDWVLFAGDDVVDLPAFDAVHAAPVRGFAVAVGSSELPADLAAAADVEVASPAALVELLGSLRR